MRGWTAAESRYAHAGPHCAQERERDATMHARARVSECDQ